MSFGLKRDINFTVYLSISYDIAYGFFKCDLVVGIGQSPFDNSLKYLLFHLLFKNWIQTKFMYVDSISSI